MLLLLLLLVFFRLFSTSCLIGTATGNGTHFPYTFKKPISLKAGKNEIALLSLTVGLPVSVLLFRIFIK